MLTLPKAPVSPTAAGPVVEPVTMRNRECVSVEATVHRELALFGAHSLQQLVDEEPIVGCTAASYFLLSFQKRPRYCWAILSVSFLSTPTSTTRTYFWSRKVACSLSLLLSLFVRQ